MNNDAQARAVLSTVRVAYDLDRAPLAIQSSAVAPWLGDPVSLDPNATVAFSQHFGTILALSALAVGAHTVRVRIYLSGVRFEDLGNVTFFVDAAGTEPASDPASRIETAAWVLTFPSRPAVDPSSRPLALTYSVAGRWRIRVSRSASSSHPLAAHITSSRAGIPSGKDS
jgi:hypothetical protein